MTDDDRSRIRQLKQRIAEWDAEHEQELQQYRGAHQGLKKSLQLSQRIALLGSTPSVIWILCWAAITDANDSTLHQVIRVFGTLVIFTIILAGTARASGLAAHWWFGRSAGHERLATISISLLAATMLFGWVMVLFQW
jgi:hypothetical protein